MKHNLLHFLPQRNLQSGIRPFRQRSKEPDWVQEELLERNLIYESYISDINTKTLHIT